MLNIKGEEKKKKAAVKANTQNISKLFAKSEFVNYKMNNVLDVRKTTDIFFVPDSQSTFDEDENEMDIDEQSPVAESSENIQENYDSLTGY